MNPILKKHGQMPRLLKQLSAAEAYQKFSFIISTIIAVLLGISVSISQTATAFYLSSLSFIFSIFSFIAFLIFLFLFFNARKQTPVRDPAISVKFQGAAFRYWFIAHSLIWIFIFNSALSFIYIIFLPSPLLIIILAGIVAIVVLSIAGAFFSPTLHTSRMLGLCWKSPIPENIKKKPILYASATVFLSQRYEQAALYDQKQSIPLLWSISRAFEPSPVGSVSRKLELIPSAFNIKMIFNEIKHRFNVLIPLFLITAILSAIPFILGVNPVSPDSVPRDWPIFPRNADTPQSQLQSLQKDINKPSNPDKPENQKNSENMYSSQKDQNINKDDIEKKEEDINSNTENSSQLPPGNQDDEIGIEKNSSTQMNSNTDNNTNFGTNKKTGEDQNSPDQRNRLNNQNQQKQQNQPYSQDQKNQNYKQNEQSQKNQTNQANQKETNSNLPSNSNKNNGANKKTGENQNSSDQQKQQYPQNQKNQDSHQNKQGQTDQNFQKGAGKKEGEQTGEKDKGNQGQSGQSQKSGNSQSQQPDQKGPGQSQGEGSQQDSNQNGQASGAGQDSQQGKNSAIQKIQQGNGQDSGGSGGKGQGKGSPDEKPKMSDEPEPLEPLPSRSSPIVSIELPTLDPSGKAGKNPYKEQKDKSSQPPKSKAPTSQYSTEKQNPSISKPDQFLPNWIRIILLLK